MKKLLQIHLSDRCNLKCKHCYQDNENCHIILKIDKFTQILDEFMNYCKTSNVDNITLNITGGEPLLINNIINYLDVALEYGISRINFLTNGILLNEDILKQLKLRNRVNIQVSLEGDRTINDYIRGAGTFDKILYNIKIAKSMGIPIKVSYTINDLNYLFIDEVTNKVKDSGASGIWFDRYIAFKDNSIPEISTEHFIMILHDMPILKEKYQDGSFNVLTSRSLQFLFDDKIKTVYSCGGCSQNLTILSNCDVLPCRRLPIVLGNLNNNSLCEILNSKLAKSVLFKLSSCPVECNDCIYKDKCLGGLKCLTYAQSKTLDKADPNCPYIQYKKLLNQ